MFWIWGEILLISDGFTCSLNPEIISQEFQNVISKILSFIPKKNIMINIFNHVKLKLS